MPVHKHTRDMISAEPSVSATPAGTIKTISGVTGGGTIFGTARQAAGDALGLETGHSAQPGLLFRTL